MRSSGWGAVRASGGRAGARLPPGGLPLAGARPDPLRTDRSGIGDAQYYLPPLHLQPALRYLGYEAGSLPETERAAAENFSVPLWAGITLEQQERVVDVVRAAVGVASRA